MPADDAVEYKSMNRLKQLEMQKACLGADPIDSTSPTADRKEGQNEGKKNDIPGFLVQEIFLAVCSSTKQKKQGNLLTFGTRGVCKSSCTAAATPLTSMPAYNK
jgi:hypothetical protein